VHVSFICAARPADNQRYGRSRRPDTEPLVRLQRRPCRPVSRAGDRAPRGDRDPGRPRLVHTSVELAQGPLRAIAGGARRARRPPAEPRPRPPLLPGASLPRTGRAAFAPRGRRLEPVQRPPRRRGSGDRCPVRGPPHLRMDCLRAGGVARGRADRRGRPVHERLPRGRCGRGRVLLRAAAAPEPPSRARSPRPTPAPASRR